MSIFSRTLHGDAVRYALALPGHGEILVDYAWPAAMDEALGPRIVTLMRQTTASAPIIGFGQAITDEEAHNYIKDLSGNLAAGKIRLLTISTGDGELIGLCTLRRNLSPNNRHLTDLAKGMIHESFRGGAVLPAAFKEIALRCEADGVEVVTLDVRADTPAHRTWERFGFRTWGVLPVYARAQGAMHAGHFMFQPVAELKQRAADILTSLAARSSAAAVRA